MKLRIMNSEGDRTLELIPGKNDEEVKREFDRLVGDGFLAYRVDAPGKGQHIREFDPSADEIVITGPLVGG